MGMTIDEAIKHGKEQLEIFGGEHREFIELAIKALEQEPTDKIFTKADIDAIVKAINKGWELRVNEVLDKIRAEIEFEVDHRTNMLCAEDVFEILDKYKAETEGKG